ncbi:hypothetical protein KFE25_008208 [Diacronema lutheri]|uniref:Ubiquitin-like domain-containing protein n=1 Tax=Diacronema lutheri TaxID=2081491 RepID=A0A8J5XND9_DIALT|nr:hypothetical protein KFE25_008208 [Diacronema lutheri]
MESAGAGGLPPLVVHQAETGLTYLLTPESSTSVEAVKYALAPASGVALEHQILLYDGEKLDDSRPLADYGLPHEGNAIFMFNRAMLARDAQPPSAVQPNPAELRLEAAPELPAAQLRKGASPLVSALLDYRTQFHAHLCAARAHRDFGEARLADVARHLSLARVQHAALRAALANLRAFASQLAERYARFKERFHEELQHKQSLVDSFEADIGRLRAIRLHPVLSLIEGFGTGCGGSTSCRGHDGGSADAADAAGASAPPETLLDCCGEGRLRTWLHECEQHADTLVSRAAELATTHGELRHAVDLQEKAAALPLGALGAGGGEQAAGARDGGDDGVEADLRWRLMRARLDDATNIVRALEADYARVSTLVDEQLDQHGADQHGGAECGGSGSALAGGEGEGSRSSVRGGACVAACGGGGGGGGGGAPSTSERAAERAAERANAVEAASELSLLRRNSVSGSGSNVRLSHECAALEDLRVAHTDVALPALGTADDDMFAAQRAVCADRTALTRELHTRLRAVSSLQAAIADLRARLGVYSTLLARVQNYCVHLEFLHRLPFTYAACLAQISCRRAYAAAFEARAHAAVEALAQMRDDEFGARMAFMAEYGRMLPRGLPVLARLLQSPPPHCEVRMPAPELPAHLPAVTEADIADVLAAADGTGDVAGAVGARGASAVRLAFANAAGAGDGATGAAGAPASAAAAHGGLDARVRILETENAKLRAELAYRAVRALSVAAERGGGGAGSASGAPRAARRGAGAAAARAGGAVASGVPAADGGLLPDAPAGAVSGAIGEDALVPLDALHAPASRRPPPLLFARAQSSPGAATDTEAAAGGSAQMLAAAEAAAESARALELAKAYARSLEACSVDKDTQMAKYEARIAELEGALRARGELTGVGAGALGAGTLLVTPAPDAAPGEAAAAGVGHTAARVARVGHTAVPARAHDGGGAGVRGVDAVGAAGSVAGVEASGALPGSGAADGARARVDEAPALCALAAREDGDGRGGEPVPVSALSASAASDVTPAVGGADVTALRSSAASSADSTNDDSVDGGGSGASGGGGARAHGAAPPVAAAPGQAPLSRASAAALAPASAAPEAALVHAASGAADSAAAPPGRAGSVTVETGGVTVETGGVTVETGGVTVESGGVTDALAASPVLALRGAPASASVETLPPSTPAAERAALAGGAGAAEAKAIGAASPTIAQRSLCVLRKGITEARRCLPPPGVTGVTGVTADLPPASVGAAAAGAAGAAADDAAAFAAVERAELDADTSSVTLLLASARQAARANMTLGRALQQARALAQSRIAYLSIEVNSRVLFVAVTREARSVDRVAPADSAGRSAGVFVAYASGLPNRFLAPKSVAAFVRGARDGGQADSAAVGAEDAAAAGAMAAVPAAGSGGTWFVGEVRAIEGPLVASGDAASDRFNLPQGSLYWLLTAEPVSVLPPAIGASASASPAQMP